MIYILARARVCVCVRVCVCECVYVCSEVLKGLRDLTRPLIESELSLIEYKP